MNARLIVTEVPEPLPTLRHPLRWLKYLPIRLIERWPSTPHERRAVDVFNKYVEAEEELRERGGGVTLQVLALTEEELDEANAVLDLVTLLLNAGSVADAATRDA